VTFCHARHETVTHGNSKTNQFVTIKLQRFWHHRNVCSIVKKWSNRDDRQTYTHRHTDTIFFYCFIVFRDLNNVQKSHKKWGYKNFITSARIRMPKYWIHAKNKIFVHPLFSAFSPETQLYILLCRPSVCPSVRPSAR
jgi:hypothetical protein